MTQQHGRRWRWVVGGFALCLMGLLLVAATNRTTTIWRFDNGLFTDTIGAHTSGADITASSEIIVSMPAEETIAAAGTITANACGTIKRVSAAGAVTTNTTNTFTAPAAANAGCIMHLCNTGATNTITLDDNALFDAIDGANIALAAGACVTVGSTGAIWKSLTPLVDGTL